MLNLVIKDLKVGAVFLWVVVPVYLIVALSASGVGGVFFWVNVTVACQLLVGVSMIDWKNSADRFVLSLPVARATAVRARYGTAILIGLSSLAVGAVTGVARAHALAMRGESWPRWVAADVGLAFVLVFAFVIAVYLPCHYRWGYGKGVVVAALVLAASIVGSDVVGPFVIGTAGRQAGLAGARDLPRGLVTHGVALLADRVGLAFAGLMVLGLAAALLWVSVQAATRAYQRHDI